VSDTPATGGTANGEQSGPGGDGAAGTQGEGQAGIVQDNAGGGGGAVGRIRINSSSTPTVDGTVSPADATGAFTLGAIQLAES